MIAAAGLMSLLCVLPLNSAGYTSLDSHGQVSSADPVTCRVLSVCFQYEAADCRRHQDSARRLSESYLEDHTLTPPGHSL